MKSKILYSDYLKLDQLLSAQEPFSGKAGQPAHEELLFIITHQAYELWFKQLVTDLESVLAEFTKDHLDDRSMSCILRRFDRMNKVLELLVNHFPVLETMEPIEFLEFRNLLGTMSGFQSMQFRMLENKLGLQRDERVRFGGCPYDHEFRPPERETLQESEEGATLFDCVERWLERTPFIERPSFEFLNVYEETLDHVIQGESRRLAAAGELTNEELEICLRGLKAMRRDFRSILERKDVPEGEGGRRMSQRALLAALFIRIYSDEPMLSLPDLLLTKIVELEANVTHFRYRHALMAQRMIGHKMGTGGTSGVHYLHKTAEQHQIFTDLYRVVTLLLPKSAMPDLPEDLRRDLDFHFTSSSEVTPH